MCDVVEADVQKRGLLENREQFNAKMLEAVLKKMDDVESRKDAAEWISYHKAQEKTIVQVWKREVLRAEPKKIPQLLFVAGDVIMMCSVSSPSLSTSFANLLPRLSTTLLQRLHRDHSQILHRALYDVSKQLSGNPYVPKHWFNSIKNILSNKVANHSHCGWLHEGLQATDEEWREAGILLGRCNNIKQDFDKQYLKLKSREISGTDEELHQMSGYVETFLSNSDHFIGRLSNIKKELSTKVLSHIDNQLNLLREHHESLTSLKKRTREESTPAIKKSKLEEDSDESSDDDNSSDGPTYVL